MYASKSQILSECCKVTAHGGVWSAYSTLTTSFYGSSCADNGKDALNTPDKSQIYIYIYIYISTVGRPDPPCAVNLYVSYLYLAEWNRRVRDVSEVYDPMYRDAHLV